MGYTLTIDASVKVRRDGSGRGSARGLVRHIFRDIEPPQKHSNRNIDSARTKNNLSYVYDAGAGDYRAAVSGDEIMQKWNARLAEVKRKPRDTDVIARPLVFNLDPVWIAEHDPDWKENGLSDEHRRLTNEMIEWVSARMGGKENCFAYSIHMDESIPQVQMLMVPVYESEKTGKILLSQKHYFPSPVALQRLHQDFRAHMRAAGYDASTSVSPRSQEHLSSADFQRKADRVKDDAYTLTERRHELDDRSNALAKSEMRLSRRERAIEDKERAADDTIAAAQKRAEEMQKQALELAEQAQTKANETIAMGQRVAKRLTDEAQAQAEKHAADIVSAAQERAKQMQAQRNETLDKRAAELDARAKDIAAQQATVNDVNAKTRQVLDGLAEQAKKADDAIKETKPIFHAKKLVSFMEKHYPEQTARVFDECMAEQRAIAEATLARINGQRSRLPQRTNPDHSYGM